MHITVTRARAAHLEACAAVFDNSPLHERYFTEPGRLERMLTSAIGRGELWMAACASGEVVGVNVETLDGNKQGIETAKQLLEMTGANYRNIYFDASSEAGTFALGIMAFPTTYVFDRNGRIVGEPLLGGIDNEKNLEMLQKTIDEALARDSAVLSK